MHGAPRGAVEGGGKSVRRGAVSLLLLLLLRVVSYSHHHAWVSATPTIMGERQQHPGPRLGGGLVCSGAGCADLRPSGTKVQMIHDGVALEHADRTVQEL